MLWSSKRLLGLKVAATDGPIGSIYDIYFEDESWSVRYVVVDTGGWLSGRRVLLSPHVFGEPDREESGVPKSMPASLTQEQIRHSPSYDFEKPISLQYETELAGYYTWPDPLSFSGFGMTPLPMPAVVPLAVHAAAAERMPGPHLRSIRDLFGYSIEVRGGGETGTAADFTIDDESWRIDRIVIETGTWLAGSKVAVPSAWSGKIRWSEQVIFLDVTKEDVEHAPEFDPQSQIQEPATRA